MDLEALDGVEVDGHLKKLNSVLFFDIIGELGIPCFWNQRECIFHLSYVMTLCSLACSVFCILSVASEENIVMSTNWSYGSSDSSRVWVGVSGSLWETLVGSNVITSYIRWTNAACSDSDENPFCTNCETGGKTVVFLVLLSCSTRIPSMMLLKARMNPISDIPLIKFLGMVSEGLAAVSLSGAMFIWREYCHVQLPAEGNMVYSYGSGFYLLALGFCMTAILFVVHTLMPTEDPYDDTSLLDEHLTCCNAKAKVAIQKEKEGRQVKNSQVKPEEGKGNANVPRRKRKKKIQQTPPDPQSDIERSSMIDLEKGASR